MRLTTWTGLEPAQISRRVNEEVIYQHAEDAAFLWTQRDHATTAANFRLRHLKKLDGRLVANLAGLRIGGPHAWETNWSLLKRGEEGALFNAGILALGVDSTGGQQLAAVQEHVHENPGLVRELIAAFAWTPAIQLRGTVATMLESKDPLVRHIGVRACSVHRTDLGPRLQGLLDDGDERVRTAALRGAAELGRADLEPRIRGQLEDPDEGCRFWAAWAGVRLGADNEALIRLETFATRPGVFRERALQLLVRRAQPDRVKTLLTKLSSDDPEKEIWSIRASGFFGDPSAVPWLMAQMKHSELAQAAGEAFSAITGVDLIYEDLDQDAPELDEEALVPQDLDSTDLPWPDPDAVSHWWSEHGKRFSAGTRLLSGWPINDDQLSAVLREGYQPQREAAALEAAVRAPRTPLFEVRAPAARQLAQLA